MESHGVETLLKKTFMANTFACVEVALTVRCDGTKVAEGGHYEVSLRWLVSGNELITAVHFGEGELAQLLYDLRAVAGITRIQGRGLGAHLTVPLTTCVLCYPHPVMVAFRHGDEVDTSVIMARVPELLAILEEMRLAIAQDREKEV